MFVVVGGLFVVVDGDVVNVCVFEMCVVLCVYFDVNIWSVMLVCLFLCGCVCCVFWWIVVFERGFNWVFFLLNV